MAELADAHGSGPCESNLMQVQVLLSASKKLLFNSSYIGLKGSFLFYKIYKKYLTI